jgi:hypothetical protein
MVACRLTAGHRMQAHQKVTELMQEQTASAMEAMGQQ